jgi:radical SAM superfamily enzyme YgiQ (UPF0313 family)
MPSYGNLFQYIKGAEWIAPPVGLAYLAAVLEKKGHEVEIFDMQVENRDFSKLLQNFNPDIVGVSSSTPLFNHAIEILKDVKKFNPKILTVIGGPHPTALPSEVAEEDCVDVSVYGEGEITICELAKNCKNLRLDKIKGISYKRNGLVVVNGPQKLIDNLDLLPFPAYHLLNLKNYRHPLMKTNRAISILTSRGCPYSCCFCNKKIFGHKFRARSPENVVDEMEFLFNEYQSKEFLIIDDNFTFNRKRVVRICEEIIKRDLDISWAAPNGVRIDTVDRELVKLMKKSGCYSLAFGIESGSPRIIKLIGKQISLDQVRKIFNICRLENIQTTALFVIGVPGETPDDLRKTIDFSKEIGADVADFHILIPLPGTPVYDHLKREGLLLETDYSKYSFHTEPVFRTKELTKDEILMWYKIAYREFYTNPQLYLNRLIKMTSFSAFRNNAKAFKTILHSFILKR